MLYTGTTLDPDAHEQIRWLAHDMDCTISDLIRQGIAAILARHGEAPPASLRRYLRAEDRDYLLGLGLDPESGELIEGLGGLDQAALPEDRRVGGAAESKP